LLARLAMAGRFTAVAGPVRFSSRRHGYDLDGDGAQELV
jgi:hypothetical protein